MTAAQERDARAAWLARAPGARRGAGGLWRVPLPAPFRGAARALHALAPECQGHDSDGGAGTPALEHLEDARAAARADGALGLVASFCHVETEALARDAGFERVGRILEVRGRLAPGAPGIEVPLDDAVSTLVAEVNAVHALATHWDPALLHWRFGDAPALHGACGVRDGDRLQALAVYSVEGEALEVQAWWALADAEGPAEQRLGGALAEVAARAGGLELRLEAPLWSPAARSLLAQGLTLRPTSRSLWVASFEPRLDLELLRGRWLWQRAEDLGPIDSHPSLEQDS